MSREYKKEDFVVFGSFGHGQTMAKTYQFYVDYYDTVDDHIHREAIEVNKESLTKKEIADEITKRLDELVKRLNTKIEVTDNDGIGGIINGDNI